jgi:hypothetical protein
MLPEVDDRLPPQLLVGAGDALVTTLPGRVSVSATAVSAILFELPREMVNVEATFCDTLAGENDADTVAGFGAVTVSAALDAAAFPPAGPVWSEPAAMLFVKEPAVELDTLTVTVQLDLGGMSPPAIVSVFDAKVRL